MKSTKQAFAKGDRIKVRAKRIRWYQDHLSIYATGEHVRTEHLPAITMWVTAKDHPIRGVVLGHSYLGFPECKVELKNKYGTEICYLAYEDLRHARDKKKAR